MMLHRVTFKRSLMKHPSNLRGNCITTIDETGKQRKTCTDGLVASAGDRGPTTGGLNYETDYQYDTMGDLICACRRHRYHGIHQLRFGLHNMAAAIVYL